MAFSFQLSSSVRVLAALCVLLLPSAQADPFLGQKAPGVNAESSQLLDELERVLGGKHRARAEERVVRFTLALLPTFQALPRTSENRLEPAAVRYLLHRHFVDSHGWYVQGLESAGRAWKNSTPADFFGNCTDNKVRAVFESRLASRGLSLHEVAVLAGILESLVLDEMTSRLHAAYRLNEMKEGEVPSEDQVHLTLRNYMLMHIDSLNPATATRNDLQKSLSDIDNIYPHWGETLKWVKQIQEEVQSASPELGTSFPAMVRVLEEVAHRYGHWQNEECTTMKKSLLKLEAPLGSGRIPLEAFYGSALQGNWQYSESLPYLMQLGALDESVPGRPSVIISNYVNSPTNCVASSAYYSICCINECEAILGNIEKLVGAPDAEPSRIAEVVATLPSDTVEAPRLLPETLLHRLDQVAAKHGGRVPLQGRLFMQWLHHAYPRECPFPHLAGESNPLTPDKWKATGQQTDASEADMHRFVAQQARVATFNKIVEQRQLPWLDEEELFISWSAQPKGEINMSLEDVGHGVLLVATVVSISMAVTLVRSVLRARAALATQPRLKLSV